MKSERRKQEKRWTLSTVLIDADGCPVVDPTIRFCKRHGIATLILYDTPHRIQRKGVETLVFDKGADSVDFALVYRVHPKNIVVIQDYGLECTADNIDTLWSTAGKTSKLLRAGKHPKGFPKRTKERAEAFARALENMLVL